MRDDKIVIISHYHFLCTILFLCKSESGNSVSFWARHDLFCLISSKKIWFCFISQNKNSVLSHLMKNESGSVSFHWKKIWFCLISSKKNLVLSHFTEKKSCPILILTWDRTGSGWEILVLAVSLYVLLRILITHKNKKKTNSIIKHMTVIELNMIKTVFPPQ